MNYWTSGAPPQHSIDALLLLNARNMDHALFQLIFTYLPPFVSCNWKASSKSKLFYYSTVLPLILFSWTAASCVVFVVLVAQQTHTHFLYHACRILFGAFSPVLVLYALYAIFETMGIRQLENHCLTAFNLQKISSVYTFSTYALKKYFPSVKKEKQHFLSHHRIYFANTACSLNYVLWELSANAELHVSVVCEILDVLRTRNAMDPRRHCTMLIFSNPANSDIQGLLFFLQNSGFRTFVVKNAQPRNAHSHHQLLLAIRGAHHRVMLRANYEVLPYQSQHPDLFGLFFDIDISSGADFDPKNHSLPTKNFMPRQVFVGAHGESELNCSFEESFRLH